MRLASLLAAALLSAPSALADEGMWTFDNFPAEAVEARYGFAPDQSWLNRVQRASVRLENGCSGSVVSRDGLVLTNHHCIVDCAQALSTARSDLVVDGFVASSRNEERICPGLETSILQSIEDVTERVRGAGDGDARQGEIGRIEEEACGDDRTRHCEVVTLYRGGQYKLYTYDRYDDVRLAFAPEQQAAFFGGDPDNFNYPRYAIDMALLRLYRDGDRVRFDNPLKVDPDGVTPGELVFVSGHPGSTNRLLTMSQLDFQRDHYLPWRVEYLAQIRGSLVTAANIGEEEQRQVREALFGVENSVKVFKGQRRALVEPAFYGRLAAAEQQLSEALLSSPELQEKHGNPFADIDAIVAKQQALWMPHQMLEVRLGAGSVLLNDARHLLRAAQERSKPSGDRLPEYADARLPALERQLTAQTPMHPVLERLEIEFWLEKTREYLGADHPAVRAMFGNQSANAIAAEIVASSTLSETGTRARLWNNPSEALGSNDPAIALIRRIDEAARAARDAYESEIDDPLAEAAGRLADLRFDVFGDAVYPDATFTLRLSYGEVKGWDDPAFGAIPPTTNIGGLYERATGAFPFNLVDSWIEAKDRLDLDKQMNFVSTNDIIGGNSGSPLVDRQGRVVGLAFDGNLHSIGGSFGYDPNLNRTVSVSSQLIVEALRNVYDADNLVTELLR